MIEGPGEQPNKRELFSSENVARVAKVLSSNSLRKVFVVGAMGSGKSTFASQLSEKTGIPHIELDKYWPLLEKEMGTRPANVTETLQAALAKQGDSYIVDHAELLGKKLEAFADAVVFLNPSSRELARSFELRKLRGAEGGWSKFGPERLQEFAATTSSSFAALSGDVVYEDQKTGVSVKIVK